MRAWRVVSLGALFCAAPLCAQTVKDGPLAALLETGRYAEAERSATARIAARPDDMDGYAALTLSVLNGNDAARREAALKLLEACTARLPNSAMCHYGVGSVLGAQALSQGMLKALGSVGRVRDALARAVELDPLLYAARNALVQFYLVVPGIAGGSVAKAREIASAASARQPEHAKLLIALVDIGQKKHDQAEAGLLSVRAGDDRELAADVAEVWGQLGFTYLNDRQDAKARAVFERMVIDRPSSPRGHYGLGRVLTDLGQFDLAIAAFERASALDRTAGLPIDYRAALAYQAKGDRDKARALLTRFVAAGKGSPQNIDDARKRLAQMADAG
ncbi:MAG: tetratricopeptide repeat protein [Burkholderiaceae bacterium]